MCRVAYLYSYKALSAYISLVCCFFACMFSNAMRAEKLPQGGTAREAGEVAATSGSASLSCSGHERAPDEHSLKLTRIITYLRTARAIATAAIAFPWFTVVGWRLGCLRSGRSVGIAEQDRNSMSLGDLRSCLFGYVCGEVIKTRYTARCRKQQHFSSRKPAIGRIHSCLFYLIARVCCFDLPLRG